MAVRLSLSWLAGCAWLKYMAGWLAGWLALSMQSWPGCWQLSAFSWLNIMPQLAWLALNVANLPDCAAISCGHGQWPDCVSGQLAIVLRNGL